MLDPTPFSNSVDPPHSGYPDEFDAHALVAQLGGEVARTLSTALERVATLAATGQIDRDGLRVLREEIDLARRTGIMGQQLVRLGSSELQLAQERVDLTGMLQEALTLRQREFRSRGISMRPTEMAEVTLVSDAALMFSLIESLLDWSAQHARSRVIIKLEARNNPTRARLTCAFLRRAPEGVSTLDVGAHHDPALSTLSWRLLKQTAYVLGLKLRRRDGSDRCEMRLSFPGAECKRQAALPGLEAEDFSVRVQHDQPLAGRHIVVLAAQRDLRTLIRDVLRPSGPMIDFVATVDEARRLFEDALPHAVIYESAQGGTHFERLRADLLLDAPSLAFIQVAEEGRAFEILEDDGGHPYASVGRADLVESLPAAMLFELSRHG